MRVMRCGEGGVGGGDGGGEEDDDQGLVGTSKNKQHVCVICVWVGAHECGIMREVKNNWKGLLSSAQGQLQRR